jgi:acetyl esterase/lipase
MSARAVVRRGAYGPHADQFGHLHLPASAEEPLPVVVLLHGGYWRATYGLDLMDALAASVVARGWAAWNVEYRRVGSGGGWPATLQDAAAAVDHVAQLAAEAPLDTGRVALVGHSAGGHLALVAAGPRGFGDDDPLPAPALRPRAVVVQAPVSDLVEAARRGLSRSAAVELLGGSPDEVPDRYRRASPVARLPLGVPLLVLHGDADMDVPADLSRALVERAAAAGDAVEGVELPGVGHMEHIDPASEAWQRAATWLSAHLDRRTEAS